MSRRVTSDGYTLGVNSAVGSGWDDQLGGSCNYSVEKGEGRWQWKKKQGEEKAKVRDLSKVEATEFRSWLDGSQGKERSPAGCQGFKHRPSGTWCGNEQKQNTGVREVGRGQTEMFTMSHWWSCHVKMVTGNGNGGLQTGKWINTFLVWPQGFWKNQRRWWSKSHFRCISHSDMLGMVIYIFIPVKKYVYKYLGSKDGETTSGLPVSLLGD